MDDLLSHWPFITTALIFSTVGQITKGTVFTLEKIGDGKGFVRGLLWWGRKTLPLHPVICGALLGLVPGIPVSSGVPQTTAATVLYFAGAGVCSTWVFSTLSSLLKQKGVELGGSMRPSAPPEDA